MSKVFELPEINPEITQAELCAFIRRKAEETSAESLVLGLSGGLDSAITAFLITQAECLIPIRLFWLPYRSSNPQNFADALLVAEILGLPLSTLEITPVVDSAISKWNVNTKVRIGNLAARARMMALFDASAAHNGVVVGTSNLSERCLGYGTLHGDLACAFNPIGRLFKTETRSLAAFIGVPDKILEKAPTADLWADQTDEKELGFSYAMADRILFLSVRMGMNRKEIASFGLESELVDRVLNRMNRFIFKSSPPEIGPQPV